MGVFTLLILGEALEVLIESPAGLLIASAGINVELAIGPLLLLFVRFILDPDRSWRRGDSLQFLPLVIGLAACSDFGRPCLRAGSRCRRTSGATLSRSSSRSRPLSSSPAWPAPSSRCAADSTRWTDSRPDAGPSRCAGSPGGWRGWGWRLASALAELEVEGRSGPRPPTAWEVVSPDFFSTLGIRVEIAVGLRECRRPTPAPRRLGGVARGRRPLAQVPPEHFEPLHYMSLMVRTGMGSAGVSEAVHRTLAELDPGLALANFQSLQDHLLYTVWRFRFSGFLLGLFAVLALVLSAIGIYGIVSHRVAHRRHEIGVRMALDADPAAVVRMMVRGGLVPGLWGLGLGLAAAAALTRLLAGVF